MSRLVSTPSHISSRELDSIFQSFCAKISKDPAGAQGQQARAESGNTAGNYSLGRPKGPFGAPAGGRVSVGNGPSLHTQAVRLHFSLSSGLLTLSQVEAAAAQVGDRNWNWDRKILYVRLFR
jgi:hypothetical protein